MPNMPSFKQYLVEEQSEVFFTYGRMNPPTIGHGKLMNVLSTKSGKNPYKIYLTHSQDARKNPLTYDQKIKHSRKMFPKHSRNIIFDKKLKSVFDVVTSLYDQGYNRLTMVVGSDRIVEFRTLLEKYNGIKARHGLYNFERINIVSAGDRDPDAEGVEGMSASKQRENVKRNDFTTFGQGVPSSMSNPDAKRLFNDIRLGMGLKETTQFKNKVYLKPVSDLREKYITGNLFNEGDRVIISSSKKEGVVHRLGANYVIVALDEGRISRQWLQNIDLIEKEVEEYDDEYTEEFGSSSLLSKMVPYLTRWVDTKTHQKQYANAVRTFLDLRKKNPKNARKNLVKAAQINNVDTRSLDKFFRSMVDKGIMPGHLVNYHPTFVSETEESVKEDEVSDVRIRIAKNTDEQDKDTRRKNDRMLDRARLVRARRKNNETK